MDSPAKKIPDFGFIGIGTWKPHCINVCSTRPPTHRVQPEVVRLPKRWC